MQAEEQIFEDIKSLKIQGATNVATAVLDALSQNPDKQLGERLAYARPTEPLAQNAVRYVFAGTNVPERIGEFKNIIADAKTKIAQNAAGIIKDGETYLTHCHSSTVTNAIISASKNGANVKVFATETRPRFQGRITAQELTTGGVDVTMIVDGAAASVIRDNTIAGVLVGADVLSDKGFVNKTGTYAIALAAKTHGVPIYCFSTLLKYGTQQVIEERDPKEIWPEAPANLRFFAPAFDFTPYDLGVTIVSEFGLLKDTVHDTVVKEYPWLILTKTI